MINESGSSLTGILYIHEIYTDEKRHDHACMIKSGSS